MRRRRRHPFPSSLPPSSVLAEKYQEEYEDSEALGRSIQRQWGERAKEAEKEEKNLGKKTGEGTMEADQPSTLLEEDSEVSRLADGPGRVWRDTAVSVVIYRTHGSRRVGFGRRPRFTPDRFWMKLTSELSR